MDDNRARERHLLRGILRHLEQIIRNRDGCADLQNQIDRLTARLREEQEAAERAAAALDEMEEEARGRRGCWLLRWFLV